MDRHKAIVVSDWKYVKSRGTKRLANALQETQKNRRRLEAKTKIVRERVPID